MEEKRLTEAEVSAYEGYLREEERSAATVENYLHGVRGFAAWLAGRAVTKELAAEWKEWLLRQELAPATVNARLSAVNGLFRFLGWEQCRIRLVKVQRRSFREADRELSREEYLRLLTAARSVGRERLALLLETLCSTGIRVSELRSITVEAARRGRSVIRLKGKIRTILLPKKLCRKLLGYARRQKTASGEIFLTRGGRGLSRKQVWREMKSLCKSAGVAPEKVFPHNLRHLFAVSFHQVCRDIVKLADVLGHSSVETTRLYLLTAGAEHARFLDRLRLIS